MEVLKITNKYKITDGRVGGCDAVAMVMSGRYCCAADRRRGGDVVPGG